MALKVYFFGNTALAKNMVATAGSHIKTEAFNQVTQFIKPDIGVRQTMQYLKQQFVVFAHC